MIDRKRLGVNSKNAAVTKYLALQILRGLSAWAVVFHHYMQLYFGFKSTTFVGAFFSHYGSMGIDVFFILSGFVMYLAAVRTEKGPARFMINRLFRVAPLYWFYTMLAVAGIFALPLAFSYTSFSMETLLASLMFLPSQNLSGIGMFPVLTVGWTLNFEMFFYASIVVCMAATKRHFFKLLTCIFLVLPFVFQKSWYYSSVASAFLLYEFLAGMALAALWTHTAWRNMVGKYHLAALVVAIGLIFVSADLPLTPHVKSAAAIVIVMFALLCERYLRENAPLTRFFVELGDESYSTYLAHAIIITVAVHFTGKNRGTLDQCLILFGICLAVLAISKLSYRWIEKNTWIEKLHQGAILRFPTNKALANSAAAEIDPVVMTDSHASGN
jgi:exopolysaccharide production protein ExoZ